MDMHCGLTRYIDASAVVMTVSARHGSLLAGHLKIKRKYVDVERERAASKDFEAVWINESIISAGLLGIGVLFKLQMKLK
jgi:hypothetical protein